VRILAAGAGGVLGRELVTVLHRKKIEVVGLGYEECEFNGLAGKLHKALYCDVTKPETIKGVCKGIDIVISTIGITRIKSNLTHMGVDYRGNLNLLEEARRGGVKKFVFISPAGVDKGHRYVPLFKAKYLFEEALKKSGIDWLIFRSGGFFNDLAKMGKMAQKGSIFIVGRGTNKFTPIDVKELAEIMVEDTLTMSNRVVEVGGPQDLSWKDICNCCFAAFNKRPRIISVPAWLCKIIALFIRPFSKRYHAMARLIIFTSTRDLPTLKRGKLNFFDYLEDCYKR
jgi:dTDP-4-dehydrorhamnose reductase